MNSQNDFKGRKDSLEGKSMPSNIAANTTNTTLLKNQSAIKYLP